MQNSKVTQVFNITPEDLKQEIVSSVVSEIKLELGVITKNFQPKENPEFITSKEACEILGVTNPTLLDWRKRKIITAYRIANKIRFKRSEIEQSLKKIA